MYSCVCILYIYERSVGKLPSDFQYLELLMYFRTLLNMHVQTLSYGVTQLIVRHHYMILCTFLQSFIQSVITSLFSSIAMETDLKWTKVSLIVVDCVFN